MIIKRFLARRQAMRLHVEQLKITRDDLRKRAKHQAHDKMAFETAHAAANRIQDKIDIIEHELQMLDRKWSW